MVQVFSVRIKQRSENSFATCSARFRSDQNAWPQAFLFQCEVVLRLRTLRHHGGGQGGQKMRQEDIDGGGCRCEQLAEVTCTFSVDVFAPSECHRELL